MGYKQGRWSIHYENCINCKTVRYGHASKGLCVSCYDKGKYKTPINLDDRIREQEKILNYLNKRKDLLKIKASIKKIIQENGLPKHIQYNIFKKESRKEKLKEIKKQNQIKIMQYLSTHPCIDCGHSDPLVLHFDHIKKENKSFAISDKMTYLWPTLLKEIEKCEVRCANCHMRRTAKQFNWSKLDILRI